MQLDHYSPFRFQTVRQHLALHLTTQACYSTRRTLPKHRKKKKKEKKASSWDFKVLFDWCGCWVHGLCVERLQGGNSPLAAGNRGNICQETWWKYTHTLHFKASSHTSTSLTSNWSHLAHDCNTHQHTNTKAFFLSYCVLLHFHLTVAPSKCFHCLMND